MRVNASRLGRWVDPAEAYVAVCGDSDSAFWLDSGPAATRGMSYLGVADEVVTQFRGPVLDWLRGALDTEVDTTEWDGGFALGLVGWLGYEVRGETMQVPVERDLRYPRAAWLRVSRALAFDHAAREVWMLSLGRDDGWRAEMAAALSAPVDAARCTSRSPSTATWAYPDAEYLRMIAACQEAIVEGDAYQLCLTTEASIPVTPDPVAAYLALRASSPTHHGALAACR